MAEKLTYNGKDITTDVTVIAAAVDLYTGSERSDVLELHFPEDEAWTTWGPQIDDVITYQRDGLDTGRLFIFDQELTSGGHVLYATTTPADMREIPRTKAWERAHLSQIGEEIAARNGLSFELMGLSDNYFEYIKQEVESDATFLAKIAMLEGAALVIFDGRIIMAKEKDLEAADPVAELDTNGSFIEIFDHSARAFGSALISVGQFKGAYTANNGSSRKLTERPRNLQASSNAECMIYAAGLLRYKNKGLAGLKITTTLSPEIPAGVTCTLGGSSVPSGWTGTLFVHHIRHEFHKNQSTVFLRKPLEGY